MADASPSTTTTTTVTFMPLTVDSERLKVFTRQNVLRLALEGVSKSRICNSFIIAGGAVSAIISKTLSRDIDVFYDAVHRNSILEALEVHDEHCCKVYHKAKSFQIEHEAHGCVRLFQNGCLPLDLIPVEVPYGDTFLNVVQRLVATFDMPQLRAYYDVDTGTVFATDEAFKVNMSKVIPQGTTILHPASFDVKYAPAEARTGSYWLQTALKRIIFAQIKGFEIEGGVGSLNFVSYDEESGTCTSCHIECDQLTEVIDPLEIATYVQQLTWTKYCREEITMDAFMAEYRKAGTIGYRGCGSDSGERSRSVDICVPLPIKGTLTPAIGRKRMDLAPSTSTS